MPSFDVALKEFARVLKPGGLFAATVWQSEDKVPFFLTTRLLAAGAPPPRPACPRCKLHTALGKCGASLLAGCNCLHFSTPTQHLTH